MKVILIGLLPCVLFFIILTSCDGKFVPDPIVPVLPKYSAQGYNAAGAMVNGSVWRAISNCGFGGCRNNLNFYSDTDSLGVELRFDGELLHEDINVNTERFYFSVFLDSVQLLEKDDLELLRGRKFDLGSTNHYAEVFDYVHDTYCTSHEGQIFFDEIIFDGLNYIVAGTFGFVIEGENCSRLEVFSGRFDYVISSLH